MIGGVVALGYTIGPIVGGLLAEQVSWRVSGIIHLRLPF